MTQMEAAEAAMWLEIANLVEASEAGKRGEVRIDQDQVAQKVGVDVTVLVERISQLRMDFALLLMNSKDLCFNQRFIWMVRALAEPQPLQVGINAADARRRIAKHGAEFMDAGQEFDDVTLQNATGIPHYHVGQIVRDLNLAVDSSVEPLMGGLYNWHPGDADKWRVEAFPLAELGEPLLVFNIERMETTFVQGDQYKQVNNITYRQVIESLTQVISASQQEDDQEKQTILQRLKEFAETAGPVLDAAVKVGQLFGD